MRPSGVLLPVGNAHPTNADSSRMTMLRLIPFLIAAALLSACSRPPEAQQRVSIYVSTDREYAKPILDRFEEETGIAVDAIYDEEKDKSVGLTARLVAEKADPAADVFWN